MAGSRGSDPLLWLCPEDGDKECIEVEMKVDE